MPLSIDTSRPLRSRAEQQALVRAVYEAPAGEQETDWLEWKGPLELAGKNPPGRPAIAKAVLGFSNRNPDLAARTAGGCAYFLAGVSPGELSKVEVVDAAQLENQVAAFVGRDISWRADYVEVDGKQVLVVTVEPPQWGDPVHPARKTYNPEGGGRAALQEGTVYVRHQASTERATAADMDMLSRRAARRPGDQLAVNVRLAPETRLRAIDVGEEALERYISQEEANLLGYLSPMARRLTGSLGVLGARERRTEEQYREEVAGYVERLREELPGVLPARAVMHGIARLKLEVVNNTDTTFTKVRVEAKLPANVWVTDWQDEVRDEAEPPDPPIPYGQARLSELGWRSSLSIPALSNIRPAAMVTPWRPEVVRREDAVYVDYVPEDVRAQGVAPLPSVWLLIPDPSRQSVEVRWEATATNADRRLSGTLTVPVEPPPAGVKELMADLPEDED